MVQCWEATLANIDISASAVEGITDRSTAPLSKRRLNVDLWKHVVRSPRYTCGLIWSADLVPSTPSVDSTYHQRALGGVPEGDASHIYVTETLGKFPHLFAIITPIKADHLSTLLVTHLNQKLVDLVVQGFREGFWPGADLGMLHDLPDGLDN